MGQQCQKVCLQPNITPAAQVSQIYLKLIQSTLVDQQFPTQSIPETVREKIRLLNLKIEHKNSELWKYHQPKNDANDRPFVIYTLVNHDDIAKSVQPESQPEPLIIATSQPSLRNSQTAQKPPKINILNPHRFTEAAIFLFKLKDQSKDQDNPYVDNSKDKFEFEQFYYGAINQKMQQAHVTKIFKTGEYYQGNIKDNKMQGQGIMVNALGNHSYNGTWSKNKPQGHGVEELDKQFNYEGNFVGGKWNGHGKLTLLNLANPIHLEGIFVNGTLEGHGTVKNKINQLIFDGQFKNGKQHGPGTWYGPNGDKYQGGFVQGMKEGQGTLTFASGKVYKGSFKNGYPDGEGVLIKDNVQIRGHWFKGENILVLEEDNVVK